MSLFGLDSPDMFSKKKYEMMVLEKKQLRNLNFLKKKLDMDINRQICK